MKTLLTLLILSILLSPSLLFAQNENSNQPSGYLDPAQAQDLPQQAPSTTNSAGHAQVPAQTPRQQSPVAPASGARATTSASTSAATQERQPADAFVSLTRLPGITELNNSIINVDSLPDLFDNIYRLCIGAAAVIAVIQIMRAGVMFMTKGGSVSANNEAKDMIRNAVIGLLLVLSPAIVFGIINPRILNLELDLGGLNRDPLEQVDLRGEVPIAGEQSGPTITETGTLIRTGTFSTEAAMNTFVSQCSTRAKGTLIANIPADGGKATTRGCTQSCSPAGRGSCDAKGCSQYTAYCSVQSSASVYASDRKPVAIDSFKWNQFTVACQAAGGSPQSTYNTSQPRDCFAPDDSPTKCFDATLTCNPK